MELTTRTVWTQLAIATGLAGAVLLMVGPWHPPVGVYVVVLAIVGVCVPLIRGERISVQEKALWTGIMLTLAVLEITSIYKEQADHDRAQQKIAMSFKQVSNGLETASSGIQTAIAQANITTVLAQKNLQQEQEVLRYSTGGDEFCFLGVTLPIVNDPAHPDRWGLFVGVGNSGSNPVPIPFCEFQIQQGITPNPTREDIDRVLHPTIFRFNAVRESQGTTYYINPAPSYLVIITMPAQDYLERLTFSPSSTSITGYHPQWRVWKAGGRDADPPILDSDHPKSAKH